MPLDVSKVFLYGPADVQINGVTVGHTTMEGVTVKRTPKIAEAKVAKFGDTMVSKWQDGEKIEVEFTLAQSDFGTIVNALPTATLVTNVGGLQKLTFGQIAGTKLPSVALVLLPFVPANTPAFNLNIPKAISIGDFEVDYKGEKFNGFKCKFEGAVNESQTNGNLLWSLGDASITADLVNPVVSLVSPLDGAVGVAVGASITWTISKSLDANFVGSTNVRLFKDPTGTGPTGLGVAGTIVLTNAGASTTIVFTPSAPMSALTKHIAYLEGVRDQAGNLLASGFYATEFTTA